MGKSLTVFLNIFFFTSKFLGLKLQNKDFFLKKKMVLRVSFFYKIDVKMVTNWSLRLEKHITIEILLMVDFLRIFKNVTFFKIFRDF